MTVPSAITSRSNPRFRQCLELRQSRKRKRSGRFLIDGPRDLIRAIDQGVSVESVFCHSSLVDATSTTSLATDVASTDVNSADVASTGANSTDSQASGTDLNRVLMWASQHQVLVPVHGNLFPSLCYGQRDSHVVAIATAQTASIDSIAIGPAPLIVVLDRVEKPGNIGAVMRTADAVGADAVLLTDDSTDPLNPNAIRASAGTVFKVPWAVAPRARVQQWLQQNHISAAVARVDGPSIYWDLELAGSIAVVFGNEAEGVSPTWGGDSCFHIPMAGIADSLNVSVSAAVVLFEAKRRRFNAKTGNASAE